MKQSKILLFDGSNNIHRQLNQPNMWELNHRGVKTGGIFGFFRSMQVAMDRFPSHYPVVVFDHGRSARRYELYPNYKRALDKKKEIEEEKANLESGSIAYSGSGQEYLDELIRQTDLIKDLLRFFRVPVVSKSGWEGDDVIAIISRVVGQSVIVTDDKDMYQLIKGTDAPQGVLTKDRVSVFRPMRNDPNNGAKGHHIKFDEVVHPEFGTTRHLTVEKCILGDGSDNIPKAAEGVGGKSAQYIAEAMIRYNENREEYCEVLGSDTSRNRKRFKKFIDPESLEQYDLNIQLMDLSLVETDPAILEEFDAEVSKAFSMDAPELIPILTILGEAGIGEFDYGRFIRSLEISRANMRLKYNGFYYE